VAVVYKGRKGGIPGSGKEKRIHNGEMKKISYFLEACEEDGGGDRAEMG